MRTTLSRIQSEAARTIAGAYRATSAATLDVELFILPMHQLEKRAHETAINIRTSPVDPSSGTSFVHTTPVTTPTIRDLSQHHIIQLSSLKRLIDSLERKLGTDTLNNLEVRKAFVVEPWWTPPPIAIAGDRDTAERRHKDITTEREPPLAIYTDGSGINGKIGAAAVALTLNTHAQAFLGTETASNVYAAELQGILMGLDIATKSDRLHAVIFTDNQAALQALQNPGRPLGQYIIREIIEALIVASTHSLYVEFH